MYDFWVLNVISWIFSAIISLWQLYIIILLFIATYVAYVFSFSKFSGQDFKDVHAETSDYLWDSYSQSVIGEGLGAFGSAIAFTISSILRAAVLPLKLFSGWFVNLLQGPVEDVLEKGEKIVDKRNEKDFQRRAEQAEKATQRYIKRSIAKAKMKKIRAEIRAARSDLRIPDLSEYTDDNHTNTELKKELKNFHSENSGYLVRKQAEKLREMLESGEIENSSIETISKSMDVSENRARDIRSLLNRDGTLAKIVNKREEVS